MQYPVKATLAKPAALSSSSPSSPRPVFALLQSRPLLTPGDGLPPGLGASLPRFGPGALPFARMRYLVKATPFGHPFFAAGHFHMGLPRLLLSRLRKGDLKFSLD